MKGLLISSIIFVFVGMAIFGFLAMNHDGASHGDCFAARAQGILCTEGKILDIVSLHFGVLKIFSTATFSNTAPSLLISIILLQLLAVQIFAGRGSAFPILYKITFAERRPATPLKILLTRWLSRHENSPSC